MKELLNKVLSRLKIFGKEVYLFVSSQIFLKNFGGIVVLISLLLFFTFWWMRCYTHHGESLQVHDYTSMKLEDAIEKASGRSFEIVVNDSTYRRGMQPNIVLTQNPKPFSRVKENRKIYLTVTKSIPDLVRLPDYRGNDDFKNYSRKLERMDVDAKVRRREFRSKLEPNTILEVYFEGENITKKLEDGFEVPKGSTVEFVVSEKGGGTVPVPELVCMQFTEAEFYVKGYELVLGSVIEDATITDRNSAFVWKQTPKYSATAMLALGSQIDIYITQHLPENCQQAISPETGNPPSNRQTSQENEDF